MYYVFSSLVFHLELTRENSFYSYLLITQCKLVQISATTYGGASALFIVSKENT